MRHFTLFPCTALTTFSLALSLSFNYTGSSNALDCTPQLLATLPPSVSAIALHINFAFVVQAAAINLNWNDVHYALARLTRQLKKGGRGQLRIVVSNDGATIDEEERCTVQALFMEKFFLVKDYLSVEFAPN